MRLNDRIIAVALGSTLVSSALVACGDDKGGETSGAMTTGPEQTTSTSGTTADEPTTGPDTSGTTGPDGTTGPEPTSGTTGDPGDPALYEQCKANEADAALIAGSQCECLVESGDFPDLDACLAEYGNTAEASDCTCVVYSQDPEVKAVLDCTGGPQKTAVDCLMKAGCADPAAQQACFEAYFAIVLECPVPSNAVSNEINVECYGEAAFMCGSGEQVPEFVKCDFAVDCMDGSDEKDCENAFMCTNGTTIPDFAKCDGYLDCCPGEEACRDMSDEAGCPVFMCKNGDMIPEPWKCNGEPDCADASDEEGCPVFMCMNGDTVPEDSKCDGFPQCEDESDELDCPVFMCTSGETVPLEWKCDMEEDCEDGSDEADCP